MNLTVLKTDIRFRMEDEIRREGIRIELENQLRLSRAAFDEFSEPDSWSNLDWPRAPDAEGFPLGTLIWRPPHSRLFLKQWANSGFTVQLADPRYLEEREILGLPRVLFAPAGFKTLPLMKPDAKLLSDSWLWITDWDHAQHTVACLAEGFAWAVQAMIERDAVRRLLG